LLADSTPLFSRKTQLTDAVTAAVGARTKSLGGITPRACYVGVSNGDMKEFYDVFVEAMKKFGISDVAHIRLPLTDSQLEFMSSCSLVVLAGGDPVSGLKRMRGDERFVGTLQRLRDTGAVIMGVSAGAMQLATYLLPEDPRASAVIKGFEFIPGACVLAAHDEARDWKILRAVAAAQPAVRALALPRGCVIVVPPEGPMRALEKPAFFIQSENEVLINVP